MAGYKFPVPESAPDEGAFITVAFNKLWLPFVLGALLPLQAPINWQDPPDDISDQVAELIALLQTDLDPPP